MASNTADTGMKHTTPLRVAVLASGRGSNFQALIDASDSGRLPIEFVGLFSDKPAALALERARLAGIPTVALKPKDYPDRNAFDAALFDRIDAVQPDLIVCAGYMRILSAAAVNRYPDRMINLHPSLLPKFPGLDTHERAIAAGEAVHGASVHVVIPELDAGTVLAQAPVPILPDDDAHSLAERVQRREHPLLVACVAAIAEGRLQCGALPRFDGAPLSAPLRLGDDDALVAA
jgi:phosphoribosylglycinamide formyltransferase-1